MSPSASPSASTASPSALVPAETRPTWSLPGAPLPTPTLGDGGKCTLACSTSGIRASPRTCLDVMIDASGYSSWNKFCRKCTIDSQPDNLKTTRTSADPEDWQLLRLGTEFTFDVYMNENDKSGRPTPLQVSVLEPINEPDQGRKGWRIAWKARPTTFLPGWMLRAERTQEFVEMTAPQDGRRRSTTAYTCWETFYGVLAPVVRMAVGAQLAHAFSAWMDDLKRRAEEVEERTLASSS